MKIVIYWFALILSFEILAVSIFELAGGRYNVIMPPSVSTVAGFIIVSLALSVYSGITLIKIYNKGK